MVVIPAGSFYMGSDNGESNEKPVHRVTVTSFALAKTPITHRQWKVVMGNNPRHLQDCCDTCPV
ncbi:MAG: hypothetical protein QG652_942, partial [Pseudomonadota bacterium]|nr:hypothetical protein [Pseudomonadota bacterium]